MYLTIATLWVMALAPMAPATTVPESPEAQALVRDLLTIVSVAEKQVWTIDHYEIESLLPDALMSVCQATGTVREGARDLLKASIKQLGGPVESAWKRGGKHTPLLGPLLTLDRTLKTLDKADAVSSEHCGFLLRPHSPYVERQRPTRRFFMASEGGGLFNIRLGEEELRMGGGGSGRLALGYGLNERWSIRVGAEFGGAGLLNEEFKTEEIDLDFYAALPVVLRHRTLLWHQDLDLAGVALGAFWKETPRFAIRLGGLFGLTYSRLGAVQPWGGLRIGAEYAPATDTQDDFITLRVGLRFGVDLHF